MQKKIIAVAIAAAMTAPAIALADVTVYGVAHASYDITDAGTTDVNKVTSNSSRIGFKGSEDLGGGLSAIWQMENGVFLDTTKSTGGNTLASRNSFVGLSSKDMGTVILGKHDTPYKLATRGYDVFGDTVADNRSLMGEGAHDARGSNVIAYLTPNLSGFSGAFAYANLGNGGVATGNEETNSDTNTKVISLSGSYAVDAFSGSLAYQKADNTGNATPPAFEADSKAWKFGLGYSANGLTGNFVYENVKSDTAANSSTKARNWYLGGKYAFGNDAVKLAYTKSNDTKTNGAATDNGAKQFSVGYDHSFTKNTTVYALYTKLSNDTAGASGLGDNSSNNVAASGNGQDPSAFSFGLKHAF